MNGQTAFPKGEAYKYARLIHLKDGSMNSAVDIRKVGLDGARGPWIEMHESRMVRSSCDDEVNA